jgi:hypothetical protein
MRHEIHVAIPGNPGPLTPGERHAVPPRIGDRERLQEDAIEGGLRERRARRTDQRRAKRQHPVAIAGRPLWKQHDHLAAREPITDLGIDDGSMRPARAVDEDRALELC